MSPIIPIIKTGKLGILASTCPFLFEGSSWTSKLNLLPPFLQCLWIHSQLYLCEVWDALLFRPLPGYTQWHSLSEVCCLIAGCVRPVGMPKTWSLTTRSCIVLSYYLSMTIWSLFFFFFSPTFSRKPVIFLRAWSFIKIFVHCILVHIRTHW